MKFLNFLFSISMFVAAIAVKEEEGGDFEGDIILTPLQKILVDKGEDLSVDPLTKRGASTSGLWPGGVVHYQIDGSLAREPDAIRVIKSAMDEWSSKTCIKFIHGKNIKSFINFKKGKWCSSYVGRTGTEQSISLGSLCWRHGIVLHEIGHALGFWHEQSRPDRDKYVKVMWDNIKQGMERNFNKHPDSKVNSLGTPYDYSSVMHYGEKAFSKNGKPTIVPKKKVEIGNRIALSEYDVIQMNKLYNCIAEPPKVCKDKSSKCTKLAKKCKRNKRVQKNCKKTCNLCGRGPSTTVRTKPSSNCKDTSSDCAKKEYRCKTCRLVQIQCRKTCKLC